MSATPAKPANARLAYLVSRYPAVSHTFILREVRALRALGFDVAIASVNAPDRAPCDMSPEEREEAAGTYYIKAHGVAGALVAHASGLLRAPRGYLRGLGAALALARLDLRRLAYGIFYFTEALMVARWMARSGLTHLHAHFATAAASVGMLVRHVVPVGFSLTLHGPDEFYDAGAERLREKFASADFVVCIGRYARSQAMKLAAQAHWHKFEVAPLGVDPARYDARPAPRRSTREFQLLCVGRLVPAKGQRVLLEACRRLRDQGRRFALTLVGDGPDRGALERAARELRLADCVRFAGALNEEQVLALYREADAFVLPSFAEGIPVVLMEAMAMGVPCISTRITGIPELIESGEDGLLVTPSDAGELCAAIERLMDEPRLQSRLALRGREKVLAAFDLMTNARRLGEIFRRRLAASPAAPEA